MTTFPGVGSRSDLLARRERTATAAILAAAVALLWFRVVASHAGSGHGAHGGAMHGTFGAAWLTAFGFQATMMAAMMLPTASPWVLWFATLSSERGRRAPRLAHETTAFVAGYVLVWMAYSIAGATAHVLLATSGRLHGESGTVGPIAGSLVWLVAGAYQLSPWKRACLRHCRNPLTYFLTSWREGARGALAMGLSHGAVCVLCCWALMAIAFAVGVASLSWMVAITAMLCVEKIAPSGGRASVAFGVAFLAWGSIGLARAFL